MNVAQRRATPALYLEPADVLFPAEKVDHPADDVFYLSAPEADRHGHAN